MKKITTTLFVAFAIFWSASLRAEPIKVDDIQHSGKVDFEKEILPILRRNCLACHNTTEAESDLILESPQTILKGGSEGPAVVAGKPDESLLLKLAAHIDEPVMPPEGNDVGAKNFTSQELGLLKLWIKEGATGVVTGTGVVKWQPLPAGVNPIYSVAVSEDGRFAAAGRANQIFLYHLPSKRELGRLTDPELLKGDLYNNPGVAHFDLVQSLAFSPAGDTLASGGYKTVKIWKREPVAVSSKIGGLKSAPTVVATSANFSTMAIGYADGSMSLVDAASKSVKNTFQAGEGAVAAVAFSAAGDSLAVAVGNTYSLFKTDGSKISEPSDTAVAITSLAFVSEDKRVATGHADNKIRVWEITKPEAKEGEEPADNKPALELAGHTGAITSLVSFGEKREFLISGGDTTLRHWSANDGKQIRQMAHSGPVTKVAVSSNSQRFVSIGANPAARIFNAADGKQIAEVKGDHNKVFQVEAITRSVALAKRHIAAAKKDLDEGQKRKKSEEDNLKKGEENVKKTDTEAKAKTEAAKKPLADKEAADKSLAEKQKELTAAEATKTTAEEAFKKADEALKAAQAKRDEANKTEDEAAKKSAEEAFQKATADRKAADDANKKAVQDFNKIKQEETQLANKAKQLDAPATKARDERDAAVRAFEAAQRSVVRAKESVKKATDAIPVFEAAVKTYEQLEKTRTANLEQAKKAQAEDAKNLIAVAISPDNKTLAVADESPSIRTWDIETGAPLEVIDTKESGGVATHLAFNAQGELLSGNASQELLVWNVSPQWNLAKTIGAPTSKEFEDRVTALDFNGDGTQLVTGGGQPSRNGELKIWNVESGSLIKAFPDAHSDTIFGVAFSPDDKTLATCGADRFGKTFDIASGKLLKSFEGHTHHVLDISWSADGRTIVTSGADMVVKIWDFKTGDQKRTITGYKKEVTSVEFIADGDNFITTSGDKSVMIKRADNGGNVRSFAGNTDFVYTADASGDGKEIVAGGEDSVLRVWNDAGQVFATFEPPKDESAVEEKTP